MSMYSSGISGKFLSNTILMMMMFMLPSLKPNFFFKKKTRKLNDDWLLLLLSLFHWKWANRNISRAHPKCIRFDNWHDYLQLCHSVNLALTICHAICSCLPPIDHQLWKFISLSIKSKNHEIFSIMFMNVSSIWLWFLINFSLAGF